MNIRFTDYAEETLKEREISKKIISYALFNPDEIVEGSDDRIIIHKIINKKLLRVVCEIEANVYIVVTAYYTYPERYMRK